MILGAQVHRMRNSIGLCCSKKLVWRNLLNLGQLEIRGILVFSQFLTSEKCVDYCFQLS